MEANILTRMHSAEHLLNSTMVKMFACNRSFSAHINKKKSKCDYHFKRPLTIDEIAEIEKRVNDIIQKNLPVTEALLRREDANQQFNLERLPESVGDEVRIIRIGDYDAIPCIGEHIQSTGEIKGFKITTVDFENGILRIRFKITK
ncbi:hypothetical protein KJ966_03260 [bacterium]|nr:hypothetical protein [bacterium]